MGNCEFIHIDDICESQISTGNLDFICKWCGRIVTETELIKSNHSVKSHSFSCSVLRTEVVKSPILPTVLFNFSASFLKHLISGRKVCSIKQIRARFLKCVPCRFYNKLEHPHGKCQICGCYVNLFPAHKALNKLAWADSECSNSSDKQWFEETT